MKYLSECSLSELVLQIQKGELSPEQLINDLCSKINNWDDKIHAFLPEKNRKERLSDELKELLNVFSDPEEKPILFGIPIGVKDIFRVDGFPTKAGSQLPPAVFEGKESSAVTRLKNAGALILGKTVTTEFAYFQSGPTRNPNNFDHTPGGSSSGSAAAVAAGFCPLSLGTQTIGSITRPAAYCGVFGFKPSAGRIPTDGVLPFSSTADQIGFFTQDLEGCKIAASILCDNWRYEIPLSDNKPVLGIPAGAYLEQASNTILNLFNTTIKELKKSDYKIIEKPVFKNLGEINFLHNEMIAYEFARVHKEWYSQYKELYSIPSKELIEKGNSVTEDSYKKAKDRMFILRDLLSTVMKTEGIDLWLSPSATSLPLKGLSSTGDPATSLHWTYAGVPTLSIPAGEIKDLPFGLQVSAMFGRDEELLYFSKYLSAVISKN